jgi:outer membrane protein OmpA-like peptidoglycan-associated protein
VLAATSAAARAEFRGLVASAARPGERLLVLSAATGGAIGSYTAPPAPQMTGPAFPAALPPDASQFQQSQYQQRTRAADQAVARDERLLAATQERQLASWASRTTTAALSAAGPMPDAARMGTAIADAVATVAALQAGQPAPAAREVLAIVGAGAVPPRLSASLNGVTALVTGVPDALQDAAWQADLLQDGADQVYVLDQADETGLGALVTSSLDEHAVTFALSRVRYGPAQYVLPASARPALDRLRQLLAVTDPRATATINGYTDSIPTPGGNLALSWRRAQAVLTWLVQHGIAASRLQAVGHGAADPVAPNRAGGQPLNRRVVVIITP